MERFLAFPNKADERGPRGVFVRVNKNKAARTPPELRCCLPMRTLLGFPDPEDVAAIERLVHELYAWVSSPNGPRSAELLERMFAPTGRLAFPGEPNGASWLVMTPGDFTARLNAQLEGAGFYERELEAYLSAFGRTAHVSSTYESGLDGAHPDVRRGVNSFQLVKIATEWKFLSICWDYESAESRLPLPVRR